MIGPMMPGPGIGGGAGGDPYWPNVISLLWMQGTNGSTTVTDQVAGPTWSCNGSCAISTAHSEFGTSSLYFPNSATSYLLSGEPAAYWYAIATKFSSWTIEVDVFFNNVTTTQVIIDAGGVATSAYGIALLLDSTGKLDFSWTVGVAGTYLARLQYGSVSASTWTRIAISFDHSAGTYGTVYLFMNGTLIGSQALGNTGSTSPYNTLNMGRYASGGTLPLNGYIGQFRGTQNVCRYNANYTPYAGLWPNHS